MSDYYDGYREGMAQASRETAALREQLDALLKSVADLKSLTMPPTPIHLTIPSARKPTTVEEWVAMPHPEDIERMKEMREWQGLDEDEVEEILEGFPMGTYSEQAFAQAIEQALKEKNT